MANIMSNGEIKRKTKHTTLSKQFQNPISNRRKIQSQFPRFSGFMFLIFLGLFLFVVLPRFVYLM
jgi:hypothetical protein